MKIKTYVLLPINYNNYKFSESQKHFLGFLSVFWGDLEGVGTCIVLPSTQATFKSPALLMLMKYEKAG